MTSVWCKRRSATRRKQRPRHHHRPLFVSTSLEPRPPPSPWPPSPASAGTARVQLKHVTVTDWQPVTRGLTRQNIRLAAFYVSEEPDGRKNKQVVSQLGRRSKGPGVPPPRPAFDLQRADPSAGGGETEAAWAGTPEAPLHGLLSAVPLFPPLNPKPGTHPSGQRPLHRPGRAGPCESPLPREKTERERRGTERGHWLILPPQKHKTSLLSPETGVHRTAASGGCSTSPRWQRSRNGETRRIAGRGRCSERVRRRRTTLAGQDGGEQGWE